MKSLALSAAGYGTRLQAHYIERFLYPNMDLHARDVNGSALFVPGTYKFNFNAILNLTGTRWDLIVPSYNLKELGHLMEMVIPDTSKAILRHYLPDPYHIPYKGKTNDPNIDGPVVVTKPMHSSGGKGLRVIAAKDSSELDPVELESVVQEYVPGFELIIDGVVTEYDIHYSYRMSLDRAGGMDTLVSFVDLKNTEWQVREIMSNVVLTYMGPFNIQCRLYRGQEWRAMEIDFRFSGSSIINRAYDMLLRTFKEEVGGSPKWGAKPRKGLFKIDGQYNPRAVEIYRDLELLPPYNWEQ